jgi:hypothetical protein
MEKWGEAMMYKAIYPGNRVARRLIGYDANARSHGGLMPDRFDLEEKGDYMTSSEPRPTPPGYSMAD